MIYLLENNNIDSNELIEVAKNYLETNKCCVDYPNCQHPVHQSDTKLFDLNEQNIFKLKKQLFDYFGHQNVMYINSWVYKRDKGPNTGGVWHNHSSNPTYSPISTQQNYKVKSCILYLNDTNLGTEFEDENFFIRIKPKKMIWYIFDGTLHHKPEYGHLEKDRYVISCDVILKDYK